MHALRILPSTSANKITDLQNLKSRATLKIGNELVSEIVREEKNCAECSPTLIPHNTVSSAVSKALAEPIERAGRRKSFAIDFPHALDVTRDVHLGDSLAAFLWRPPL